jgi:flagellum-specific ATP synthase
VQSLLASVLERLGCGAVGAITGLITVLVDGDDMDEPITDAARGILDGHIILSRKIAAQGHYPAVDVLPSVSRVFREVTSDEHQQNATKLRALLATHADVADLIQIGAYKAGTSPQVDRAVQIIPAAKRFLQQTVNQKAGWLETQAQMKTLAAAWPW